MTSAPASAGEITALIERANGGDAEAVNELFEKLYADLHHLAHARLRHHAPFTVLDTTALLHESYLRFVNAGRLNVSNRAHFMAYASRTMRSIIVDFARRRLADRRDARQTARSQHARRSAVCATRVRPRHWRAATRGRPGVRRARADRGKAVCPVAAATNLVALGIVADTRTGQLAEARALLDAQTRRLESIEIVPLAARVNLGIAAAELLAREGRESESKAHAASLRAAIAARDDRA